MKISRKLLCAMTTSLALLGLNTRQNVTVSKSSTGTIGRAIAPKIPKRTRICFGLGIISLLLAWFSKLSPIKRFAVIIALIAVLGVLRGPVSWFIAKCVSIAIYSISELVQDFTKTLSWFRL